MIRLAALVILVASAIHAEPVVSVDITLAPEEPYEDAVATILELGATATSLSLMWDELEPSPGQYAPAQDWPAVANLYFPTTGLGLTLTFSVIDTTADRRPADLQGLPWDDAQVIGRFIAHAEAVLGRMPAVDLAAIAVGNEVDVLLSDPDEIAAYARFLAAVRPSIAEMRPGVPFGTKLTFAGLTDPARDYSALTDASSGVFATYYPLGAGFTLRPISDVPTDLASLANLAGEKGLWLLEAGYPSDGCGAPPDGQERFVEAVFAAAAATENIRLLSYTYLTDLSDPELDAYAEYYGIADDCFRRYLASLGLRKGDGTVKPAADRLRTLALP